jgi:osmoprotectant transport system substrate-binding protein
MNKYWFVALALIFAICVAGCNDLSGESKQTIVIGAKPFNEQYILAEMISLILEEQGYPTEVKSGLNDATLFEGIKQDQIDVYVEYTGTAYSQLLKLPPLEAWDPEIVYQNVSDGLLENGIVVVNRIGFRDDYAIAVKEDWAAANGIETIGDLKPFASEMVFGSDLVFHERDDGLPRLKTVYGIDFADVIPMSPTLMYEAIKNGDVDAIPPYTTDTRVDLYNLRTLTDEKSALPPYHAMVLLRDDLADDATLVETLNVLDGKIDTDTMRALNAEFDIEKREARDIAREYLVQEGLIQG